MKSLAGSFFLFLSALGACTNSSKTSLTENSGGLALSGTPGSAYQDLLYFFTPGLTNSSGASLTYSASGLPAWATLNGLTGGFTGYPETPGTYSGITLNASDGTHSTSLASISVTVVGDPLRDEMWHFKNTGQTGYSSGSATVGYDLNLQDVWRSGGTGRGIRIAISDSGLEILHEDLSANVLSGASRDYKTSAPYTGDPTADASNTDGDHGTSVAGIIAARGWNSVGVRGIAPQAGIAGLNYLADGVTQTTAKLVDQADGDFDIFNQSWGADTNGDSTLSTSYQSQLTYGATSLRSGLGALYVKAAGNSFQPSSSYSWMTLDANSDPFNTSPYLIVAGALNASGVKASYASIGSCIWVSGFGGEYGTTQPAIITTDRTGCDKGYSVTGATENSFEGGGAPNSNCNYTSTFNGTSSATPMITGVIALMLEANPYLTWREVKHILAITARQVDVGFSPIVSRAVDPSGYVWDSGWVTNAAGYKFHNYYGFGVVDASAAVALAKTWTHSFKSFTSSYVDSGTISVAIPDNSITGATSNVTFASSLLVESIVVQVSATHTYTGDLGIELTSPSGTKSILFHANNAFADDTNLASMRLLSNAFYGENAAGTWRIRVVDGYAAETGTLTNWRLNVYGRAP